MADELVIGEDRVRLSRFFPYPRAVVFEAWADPAQLAQWWGCRETARVTAESEQRTGGAIRYVMHMSHGDVICSGRYESFERPERIVTKCVNGEGTGFEFESTTTVDFIEEDGGTRIQVEQIGLPPMEGCGQIVSGGLADSMGKLSAYLNV
ncbi:MAG: SRPBCC domain-containing protein [Planctomycetota bacterium]